MSDVSQGPGWWVASDGKWYPPHLRPDYRPEPPPSAAPVQPLSPPQPVGGQSPAQGERPTTPPASSPPKSPDDEGSNRRKRWPWVVGFAAVVILIAVIIGSAGSKNTDTNSTTATTGSSTSTSSTTSPTTVPPTTTTTTTAPLNVTTVTVKKLPKWPLLDTEANAPVNAKDACEWQVAVEKLALSGGQRSNSFVSTAIDYIGKDSLFAGDAGRNDPTYTQLTQAATVQDSWAFSTAANWQTRTNMITATQVTNVDGACEASHL